MKHSEGTIGPKIARAARAFEKGRTKHGRQWLVVFMNEESIVIALHASLTAAEKSLAQSPVGAAQVREFHGKLFANRSATLFQTIKSLTGLEVRGVHAEIESTNGSVVQVFTTETLGEDGFLFTRRESAGALAPQKGLPCPPSIKITTAANLTEPECVIRGNSVQIPSGSFHDEDKGANAERRCF